MKERRDVRSFEALKTFIQPELIQLPYDSFYRASNEAITQKRSEFYNQLASLLPDKSKVYYPGSGADPIPVTVFPDAIYSSKDDAEYFSWLKTGNIQQPIRHTKDINELGPFPDLNAVYADVLKNPFGDDTFDLLILHGLPSRVFSNQALAREVKRVTRPEGLVVVDDRDLPQQRFESDDVFKAGINHLFHAGFTSCQTQDWDHEKTTYYYAHSQGRTITSSQQLLSLYMAGKFAGEAPVAIQKHTLLLFKNNKA